MTTTMDDTARERIRQAVARALWATAVGLPVWTEWRIGGKAAAKWCDRADAAIAAHVAALEAEEAAIVSEMTPSAEVRAIRVMIGMTAIRRGEERVPMIMAIERAYRDGAAAYRAMLAARPKVMEG